MSEYDRGYSRGLADACSRRPCRVHRRLSCHGGYIPPVPGDAFADSYWRGYRDGYQDAHV